MKKPIVQVYMDGGLIQNIQCDGDVIVIVHDYDVEGSDRDERLLDDNGEEYLEDSWDFSNAKQME